MQGPSAITEEVGSRSLSDMLHPDRRDREIPLSAFSQGGFMQTRSPDRECRTTWGPSLGNFEDDEAARWLRQHDPDSQPKRRGRPPGIKPSAGSTP